MPTANPYVFGPPIKDPARFFGRRGEVDQLGRCIRQCASMSIVGERRIGKTSLLYYLASRPERDRVPVLINPHLRLRGVGDFCTRVVRQLARELGRPLVSDPTRQSDEETLTDVLESIAPARLTLLVDEFDYLAHEAGFGDEFLMYLKSLAETYEVSLVLTSSVSLEACTAAWRLAPRFCSIFRHMHLGPFDEEETSQFIAETSRQSGVDLTPYGPQTQELSGGFPAFVQLACFYYYEALLARSPLEPDDHRRIRQDFAHQVEPHLERIWRETLSDQEKECLQALCHGNGSTHAEQLQELTRKGYVVNGRVFSSVLEEMLLRNGAAAGAAAQEHTTPGEASNSLVMDERGEVWVEGKQIVPPLTDNEHRLLTYLWRNRGGIRSRYDIVEAVWGSDYIEGSDDQRIAKLVSRLRRRIEPDPRKPRYLITAHGRGYKVER